MGLDVKEFLIVLKCPEWCILLLPGEKLWLKKKENYDTNYQIKLLQKLYLIAQEISFILTSVLSSSASGSSLSTSGAKPPAFLCSSGLICSSSMLMVMASLLASNRVPASSNSYYMTQKREKILGISFDRFLRCWHRESYCHIATQEQEDVYYWMPHMHGKLWSNIHFLETHSLKRHPPWNWKGSFADAILYKDHFQKTSLTGICR